MPISLEGEKYAYTLRFSFPNTTNEVEYESIISGPKMCKTLEVNNIKVLTTHNWWSVRSEEFGASKRKWLNTWLRFKNISKTSFNLRQPI